MRDPSEARLATMWIARGADTTIYCARCDSSAVALVVGESIYRWRCVRCGWQSPWFRVVDGQAQRLGRTEVYFITGIGS